MLLADGVDAAQGKAHFFAALRPFLGFGPDPEKRYEEIAATLEMPLGTFKSHVFRLRKRWRLRKQSSKYNSRACW